MNAPRHEWPARLEIDPSVYLASGAIVTGEVAIGARSSVWFHTVVRGDTERIRIGADTNLQDLTLVHVDPDLPAIVGDRVTVGHRAIVHGCVIGDDCLIGMGAIVLSGARVGAGSLVGAGALVREGQEIPPGSLVVGAPARVVGPVTEAHRAAIERGTRHYVALSREYLARGFGQTIPPAAGPLGAVGVPRAAMSFSEWGRHLAALAEGPAWAAERLAGTGEERWCRRPAEGRWCAHEVIAHLLDCDAEIFGPRLERLLHERGPRFDEVDVASRRRGAALPADPPPALIERWRAQRAPLLARLAPLGPGEWRRSGFHARLGPYALADMVRAWVEHELSHRRQLQAALGGPE
jgi:carbonic anhydrase/acetyltransferase-like protein (isoleucine patch superfamily)